MIEGLKPNNNFKEIKQSPSDITPNFFKDLPLTHKFDTSLAISCKEKLTDEQAIQIKEQSGYSNEIIDNIGNWGEYNIYKNAALKEISINEKKYLITNNIDWGQKDSMGRTNRQRTDQGFPAINKQGNAIELHHIGQHSDSPLAELTTEQHRGKGNDSILHNKTKESEINRQQFNNERVAYWKSRSFI